MTVKKRKTEATNDNKHRKTTVKLSIKKRMATDTKILGMTIKSTVILRVALVDGLSKNLKLVIMRLRFLATLGMTIGNQNDNRKSE